MSLNVRFHKILLFYFIALTSLSLAELITARIIGRLAFLMLNNPVISFLYNLGVSLVKVVTIMCFIAFALLAYLLVSRREYLLLLISSLLITLIPISLLLPSYTYMTTALLVVSIITYLIKSSWSNIKHVITILSISIVILLGIIDLLFKPAPAFRLLVELSIIPTSVTIYLNYRGIGAVSTRGKLLSISLPLIILVVPQFPISTLVPSRYVLEVMPWVIRMVSAFSLGLLFLLPLEVYAIALALVLLTIFRTIKRQTFAALGLILLIVAGLPSWNIYPLLILTLGLVLLSFFNNFSQNERSASI